MIKVRNYINFISESFLDYPNADDISIVLYLPGCSRDCEGCQNSDLRFFDSFENIDILIDILKQKCFKAHTNKICLQGGDPLYKNNLIITKYILTKLSQNYDICIYTGANIDEVKKTDLKGFKFIKCGIFDKTKYIGSKKTNTYIQFATSNQELYDENLKLLSAKGVFYF